MGKNSEANLFFPAEWHNQQFIQLTWPHAKSDWRYMLKEVEACFIELAKAISERMDLLIVTPEKQDVEKKLKKAGIDMTNVIVFSCPTNDTWARDHGFITLMDKDNGDCHYLDFCFNGWGKKFKANLDNAINRNLYNSGIIKGTYVDLNNWVLEGGSIETDGKGTLLTTSQCLLAPNRNSMMKYNLEAALTKLLHCNRVLWLDYGNLIGDDTDGHIDTIARFAPDDTIVYMAPNKDDEEQFYDLTMMEEQLRSFRTAEGNPYRLLALPSPRPIYDEDGQRLPATYANFLIMHETVLYPTYAQPDNDARAAEVLKTAFPDSEIVGIDCRALIKQHGSLHCVTMQYPSNIPSFYSWKKFTLD